MYENQDIGSLQIKIFNTDAIETYFALETYTKDIDLIATVVPAASRRVPVRHVPHGAGGGLAADPVLGDGAAAAGCFTQAARRHAARLRVSQCCQER